MDIYGFPVDVCPICGVSFPCFNMGKHAKYVKDDKPLTYKEMKKKLCPVCGKRSLVSSIVGNLLIRKCRCGYENQFPLEVL